jgi:VanZ family protein
LLRLLLIVVALIVYGSLYPFSFQSPGWGAPWDHIRFRPGPLNRYVVRDAAVNWLIYIPVGVFGFLAFAGRTRGLVRYALPVLLGFVLSATIEAAQIFAPYRISSVFDVVCNVAGSVTGVAVGTLFRGSLRRTVEHVGRSRSRTPAAALLLLGCWLGYQLMPFFPALSRTVITSKIRAFFSGVTFSIPEFVGAFMEWTALAALLATIAGAGNALRWTLVLALVLPARLFLLGRTLTPSEVAGAAVALIVGRWLLTNLRKPVPVAACAVVIGIIAVGLAPYRIAAVPVDLSWVPFAGVLESARDSGTQILLRKAFWYGTAIYLFHNMGYGWRGPSVVLALVLAAIEFAQRYLPGRSADVTDPLLALLLGVLLSTLHKFRK